MRVVIVRFANFPADYCNTLIGRLQPAAASGNGSVVVLSHSADGVWTRQAIWGGRTDAVDVMEAVKKQFDPYNLLNPGRFVFR